jgi:hypothetical protein
MKRFLKIAAVLVVLGVVGVVVIGFSLGPIVKKSVNTLGPKLTGTKVELAGASVSPLTGSGTLSGLLVGNPEGWTLDKALYLGSVRAGLQPTSLLGKHVVVTEVHVDAPEFFYERRLLGGSNIDALLEQIETNIGGGKTGGPAEPAGEPLKFVVKSLRIENAKMTLVAAGQSISLSLPPLVLTDIGVAEGGITADQLAVVVLKRVLVQMGAAAANAVTSVGGAALDHGAKGAKSAFDKLLGK